MNCPEAIENLHLLLDGEPLPSGSGLHDHLRECRDCRARFHSADLLLRGLRRMPSVQVPASFAERVAAAGLRQARGRRRRTIAWWIAAAAVLVLGVGLGIFLAGRTAEPGRSNDLAVAPSTPGTSSVSGKSAASTMDFALSLALRAAAARAMEPSLESLGQVRSGYAQGIEPVTQSANRARDMFFRLLPGNLASPSGT